MKFVRIILTDLAGVTLIILAVLTGWLPGPGGIPLFLAGLGLLAIHHEWAKKLLQNIKTHGLRLANKFFSEHKVFMTILDAVSLVLVCFATYLLVTKTGVVRGLGLALFFSALALVLGNRRRLARIHSFFKRKP